MLHARFNAHNGGGGGAGSRLPKFAQDIAEILFRGPGENFLAQTGGQGLGSGIFGDMLQGYENGPASQLFGGLGGLPAQGQWANDYFGGNAANLTNRALGPQMQMNDMAARGAGHSADYNDMNGAFLDQSGRAYNGLMSRLNNGPSLEGLRSLGDPSLANSYGIGQVGQEALNASHNVGPDSELYKSTLSFLKPQVRSAFASRGMGDSGQSISAEGDQARQLADSFAQRSQAEKNAFLQTAAGSEGTSAGFQGARNNALANIFGSRAGMASGLNSALANIFGTQVQGGLGATEAPGRVFSTMQGGLGQGIQNIGNATGQYLQPLQTNQAGLGGFNAAMQTPVNMQQMLYNFFRSPQTQALGLPSSTGQQQLSKPNQGILGDLLGYQKNG